MVAAGVAAPLLRKRVAAAPLVTQAVAFGAPLALAVAAPRSRRRDLGICALQMWAYVAAYKSPHDDERAQAERVHIDYPIVIDRVLGAGELPVTRLQRWLSRSDKDGPRWRGVDRLLVWAHWSWFLVPHGTVLYVMWRRPERFARSRDPDVRRVRHGLDLLLARTDRASLVRGVRAATGRATSAA